MRSLCIVACSALARPGIYVALLVVAIPHLYCAAMGSDGSTEEHVQDDQAAQTIVTHRGLQKPPPEAAHLESVLYQLTQAEDVEAFARQRTIDLVEGRVQVIVELDEGDVLDMGAGVVIESRYQNLVRVLVPIDQLLPLSQRDGVRFVRLPQRPVANNE